MQNQVVGFDLWSALIGVLTVNQNLDLYLAKEGYLPCFLALHIVYMYLQDVQVLHHIHNV